MMVEMLRTWVRFDDRGHAHGSFPAPGPQGQRRPRGPRPVTLGSYWQLPIALVYAFQGLILFFLLASDFLVRYRIRRRIAVAEAAP